MLSANVRLDLIHVFIFLKGNEHLLFVTDDFKVINFSKSMRNQSVHVQVIEGTTRSITPKHNKCKDCGP